MTKKKYRKQCNNNENNVTLVITEDNTQIIPGAFNFIVIIFTRFTDLHNDLKDVEGI